MCVCGCVCVSVCLSVVITLCKTAVHKRCHWSVISKASLTDCYYFLLDVTIRHYITALCLQPIAVKPGSTCKSTWLGRLGICLSLFLMLLNRQKAPSLKFDHKLHPVVLYKSLNNCSCSTTGRIIYRSYGSWSLPLAPYCSTPGGERAFITPMHPPTPNSHILSGSLLLQIIPSRAKSQSLSLSLSCVSVAPPVFPQLPSMTLLL